MRLSQSGTSQMQIMKLEEMLRKKSEGQRTNESTYVDINKVCEVSLVATKEFDDESWKYQYNDIVVY